MDVDPRTRWRLRHRGRRNAAHCGCAESERRRAAGEKIAPVEPKTEPKVEAVAKVEPPKAEPAVAKPTIDYATINSVVSKNRVEVLKCYAEGAKKTPGLKGTISLQLQVEPSGKVRAQVQSTLNAPLVAACVIKAANSWKFPARQGNEIANVRGK